MRDEKERKTSALYGAFLRGHFASPHPRFLTLVMLSQVSLLCELREPAASPHSASTLHNDDDD